MRTGGFSEVARYLSEHYGLGEYGVSRQQISQWYRRETRNRDGVPFPREADQGKVPYHAGQARLFDLDAVLAWTRPGVPGINGNQRDERWRTLGE